MECNSSLCHQRLKTDHSFWQVSRDRFSQSLFFTVHVRKQLSKYSFYLPHKFKMYKHCSLIDKFSLLKLSSRCHCLIIRWHLRSQSSHMKAFLWWSFSQLCSIIFIVGFIPSSLFRFFIRPHNTLPDSSVVGCQQNLL